MAASSPILVANAFGILTAASLSAFPNTVVASFDGSPRRPARGEVPEARLRDVVDYLYTHAGESIGPVDIAGVAGAPAFKVVEGLRRRHGTEPGVLLWKARMSGA